MRIWNMVLSAIVVIAVLLTTVPFIVVSLGVFVDTGASGYYRGEDLYELNRGHWRSYREISIDNNWSTKENSVNKNASGTFNIVLRKKNNHVLH